MTVEEASTRIEPARIEHPSGELLDLSLEIVARAERLGRALHPETAAQLARTVRIMNTYYSNLIEGHNARPREIEQALQGIKPRTIGATSRSKPSPTIVFSRRSTSERRQGCCLILHR